MADPMGFYADTTVCIGCKACEVACKEWNQLPAANGGVRELSGDGYDNTRRLDGIHWRHVKFSEDRRAGRWLMMMEPACSKACPTASIQFGPIQELRQRAEGRVQQLHALGESRAYLYGADEKVLGGLNSFYLLVDKPEVYGLPSNPQLPTRRLFPSAIFSTLGAVIFGLFGLVSLRKRRMDAMADERSAQPPREG